MDADVDVRDPDEKSIMTYVAQFLQYSKDLPVAEEDVQVCSVGNRCIFLPNVVLTLQVTFAADDFQRRRHSWLQLFTEARNAAAPTRCTRNLDSSFHCGSLLRGSLLAVLLVLLDLNTRCRRCLAGSLVSASVCLVDGL